MFSSATATVDKKQMANTIISTGDKMYFMEFHPLFVVFFLCRAPLVLLKVYRQTAYPMLQFGLDG
jgi:hypothetical protein